MGKRKRRVYRRGRSEIYEGFWKRKGKEMIIQEGRKGDYRKLKMVWREKGRFRKVKLEIHC